MRLDNDRIGRIVTDASILEAEYFSTPEAKLAEVVSSEADASYFNTTPVDIVAVHQDNTFDVIKGTQDFLDVKWPYGRLSPSDISGLAEAKRSGRSIIVASFDLAMIVWLFGGVAAEKLFYPLAGSDIEWFASHVSGKKQDYFGVNGQLSKDTAEMFCCAAMSYGEVQRRRLEEYGRLLSEAEGEADEESVCEVLEQSEGSEDAEDFDDGEAYAWLSKELKDDMLSSVHAVANESQN